MSKRKTLKSFSPEDKRILETRSEENFPSGVGGKPIHKDVSEEAAVSHRSHVGSICNVCMLKWTTSNESQRQLVVSVGHRLLMSIIALVIRYSHRRKSHMKKAVFQSSDS